MPLDPSTLPVLVFNHHPWPVRTTMELHLGFGMEVDPERVTAADGTSVASQSISSRSQMGRGAGAAVAFQVDLPPLGVARYALHLVDGGSLAASSVANPPRMPAVDSVRAPRMPDGSMLTRCDGETVLDNGVLRAVIDHRTGWLAELVDQRTGVDLVAGAEGPHLQVCEDPTDTWGHRVVSYAWPGAEMPVTRVLVREDGPLRAQLRIEHRWRTSRCPRIWSWMPGATRCG